MANFKEQKNVGAIWWMESRKGTKYLSMKIEIDGEDKCFVAFKNHKSKRKHPDFKVFKSEPQKPRPRPKPKPEPLADDADYSDTGSGEDFPF